MRRADCREELEAAVAQRARATVGLLAALYGQVGDYLGPRENVHAVGHLSLGRLALTALYHGGLRAHQLANAFKALGRIRAEVDFRTPVEKGKTDNRGHRPASIA